MEVYTRLFAGISLLFLALTAVSVNLLLLFVLIIGRNEFKKYSFFILTFQLLICDLIALSAQIFLAAPTTIAGFDIYPKFLMLSLAIFDKFSYNGTLLFALILTINRFLVFIQPRINKFIFSIPRIYYTIGFIWIFLFAFIIAVSVGGCYTVFLAEKGFHFDLECIPHPIRPPWSYEIIEPVNNFAALVIPWIMLALYILTFIGLKYQLIYHKQTSLLLNNQKKRRTEVRLLLQSLIICSVLVAEYYSFYYLPKLSQLWPAFQYIDTMLLSWIMVTMNSIHAIVVFSFTKKARNLAKSVVGFSKSSHFILNTVEVRRHPNYRI